MSYQDKIQSALALVSEHNENIGKNEEGKPNPGFVDPALFSTCIKVKASTENQLKGLGYEEIKECLPDVEIGGKKIKPDGLCKEIAKVFRDRAEGDKLLLEGDEKRPVTGKKAERMTARELVEALDPEDHASPVAKRLKEMSRGEKFIVYSIGRSVDVETTLKLLMEVKQGFDGRNDIDVDGTIKPVYKIGDLPENYADENPLFPGRPLRPDGTCDQTGVKWEGVPHEARQLAYLGVKEGEIKAEGPNLYPFVEGLIETAKKGVGALRKQLRKASLKFDDLQKTGNLPTLKITLGQKEGGRSARPFDDGRQVVWAPIPGKPGGFMKPRSPMPRMR
jgi:hypothetical protein